MDNRLAITNKSDGLHPLESVIDGLENAISNLDSDLHVLYSRLDPLLTKTPTTNNPVPPVPVEGSSPVICRLAQLRELVVGMTHRTQSIRTALEV